MEPLNRFTILTHKELFEIPADITGIHGFIWQMILRDETILRWLRARGSQVFVEIVQLCPVDFDFVCHGEQRFEPTTGSHILNPIQDLLF